MITVGLDFGTHQTKVCIEDLSDRSNRTYSFMKFMNGRGDLEYVLPSVIQINEDDSISYGYVDTSKCKYGKAMTTRQEPTRPKIEKPVLNLPPKPIPQPLPKKPEQKLLDWKEQLLAATKGHPTMKIWEDECRRINISNTMRQAEWKREYDTAQTNYDLKLEEYNKIMGCYESSYKIWEEESSKLEPLIFRYFKQATFTSRNWGYVIKPHILSVWYIAYILFDIFENYDTRRMGIQIGIPTGSEKIEKHRTLASSLILSALTLVEDVFKLDKNKFLKTKYDELLSLTQFIDCTKDQKKNNGIIVLPEAYAGLLSVIKYKRLEKGMNILVDIGGGTTDISFFVIGEDKTTKMNYPLIYNYISLPYGINHIMEQCGGNVFGNMLKRTTLDSEELGQEQLVQAKESYANNVSIQCLRLIKVLYSNFKRTNRHSSDLKKALNDRPVIYTGGGSTFKDMRRPIQCFSEVKHLDAYYWYGMNIEDAEEISRKGLCPILSTALGLSITQDDDDIHIEPLGSLFEEMILQANCRDFDKKDYSLDDD